MCSHSPLLCTVSQLNLFDNKLCGLDWDGRGSHDVEGIKAIADALRVAASLTKLDARVNNMGKEGKAALEKCVEGRSGFELELSVCM